MHDGTLASSPATLPLERPSNSDRQFNFRVQEHAPDHFRMTIPVARQFPTAARLEIRKFYLHKAIPVFGQIISPALIVNSALLASRHAAHGKLPVKEGHALGMLPLVIFDDKLKVFIEPVDRQHSGPSSLWALITKQKRHRRLALALHTKERVTKIENVVLVPVDALPAHSSLLS
jgi:hypothetical protein